MMMTWNVQWIGEGLAGGREGGLKEGRAGTALGRLDLQSQGPHAGPRRNEEPALSTQTMGAAPKVYTSPQPCRPREAST